MDLPPHDAGPTTLGAVTFDAATGELAGPGGREQLDPKVAAVFALLLRHRGEVVARESLFDSVWRDRVVTDDVLSRCVYQLRRQLGMAGGESYRELVETLPKRGYRLREPAGAVAAAGATGDPPVPNPTAAQDDSESRRHRWLWIAVGGVAAVLLMATIAARWPQPGDARVEAVVSAPPVARETTASVPAIEAAPNTIAVLPFADLSEARDQAFLAHGISEELLGLLARRTGLSVTARTSSFASGHEGLDVVEIGRRLRVAHLVEGSVRRAGDRLRISATLVDARDGRRIWSDSYDREFRDVLQLENEIAESIARSLASQLKAGTAGAKPVVPAAHEAFLHGRFLFNRRGDGDLDAAERYLVRAVELDPAHARAWAALSGLYGLHEASPNRDQRQLDAAMRALALEPDQPEAHVRAANYYWRQKDFAAARRHFARANELDPENPLLLGMRAGGAYADGDAARAIELQRKVVAQDPLSAIARSNLGAYLAGEGRWAEARVEYETAADLNPTLRPRFLEEIAFLSILDGQHDRAWMEGQALEPGHVRDAVFAMLAPRNGRAPEGEAALARLRAAAGTDPLAAARAAEALAFRGDVGGAMDLVEQMAAKSRVADRCMHHEADMVARMSALLAPVRDHPRWAAANARLCAAE